MKKLFTVVLIVFLMFGTTAYASTLCTVKSGDTLWKIAVRCQVGVSEIIKANPQIKNPNCIYPGQSVSVPSYGSDTRAKETEVVRLVNEIRKSYGLNPLTENWELSRVARFKSEDMRDKRYFSHHSPTYGSPFEMMKNFGIKYRYAGENIAMGYPTAKAVVDGWMNSPGHRANILNRNFTSIGVGYCSGNYWTQHFIG
jgi:uncharacterized YkwD family protein/spore coat assembly protein SafA